MSLSTSITIHWIHRRSIHINTNPDGSSKPHRNTKFYFLLSLLPPAEVFPPPDPCAAFFAVFSCRAFASLPTQTKKSKPNLEFKQPNSESTKSLDLSRRCSGVKPSSLFFPLPPVRVCARSRSRSRSLWFPREDPSQGKPKQNKEIKYLNN